MECDMDRDDIKTEVTSNIKGGEIEVFDGSIHK